MISWFPSSFTLRDTVANALKLWHKVIKDRENEKWVFRVILETCFVTLYKQDPVILY